MLTVPSGPLALGADPTFRQPNLAYLEKRYSQGAAFRFALPGPQVGVGAEHHCEVAGCMHVHSAVVMGAPELRAERQQGRLCSTQRARMTDGKLGELKRKQAWEFILARLLCSSWTTRSRGLAANRCGEVRGSHCPG